MSTKRCSWIPITLALVSIASLAMSKSISSKTEVTYREAYSPLPQNEIYGVRGSVANPDIYLNIKIFDDIEDRVQFCANACFDSDGPSESVVSCASFYVDPAASICRLYRKSLSEMEFAKSTAKKGPQYYSRSAFYTTTNTIYTVQIASGFDGSHDSQTFSVNFPYPIQFYGYNYTSGFMSINGFLSFQDTADTADINTPLPHYNGNLGSGSRIPDNVICAYWDDLALLPDSSQSSCNRGQGLSYSISGQAPYRTLSFNWRTAVSNISDSLLAMRLQFYEALPGYATLFYDPGNLTNGSSATIGMQAKRRMFAPRATLFPSKAKKPGFEKFSMVFANSGVPNRAAGFQKFKQYSYNQAFDLYNTVIAIDTVANRFG